jgi:serine/threonine protein kinase
LWAIPYNSGQFRGLNSWRTPGQYEVTEQIGASGVGEVWRATDTVLGRQVAIKILPDAFAHDPERLARFEREARILASLNHSNIATIHGLEKSADHCALVMELVEGPTLLTGSRTDHFLWPRRSRSQLKSPRRSRPRTSKASSIGTSNRQTSRYALTAR